MIPKVGRLAPVIVLTWHPEFMEMFYAYQKSKKSFRSMNKDDSEDNKAEFEQQLKQSLKWVQRIQKTFYFFQEKIYSDTTQALCRILV